MRSSSFRRAASKGMLRSSRGRRDVGDFVRFLGFGVLKLVTFGPYRSGSNGLFLEGCLGLLLLATMFFVLPGSFSSVRASVSMSTITAKEGLRQRPRRHRRHADDPDQPDHEGPGQGDGPRQDRDRQPRQLDQGPHGRADDRGRRAERAAQARRDDHRGHVWQYRHGAGDCGRRQGLPLRVHDDRQAVEGEDRRAQGVRRRSHRLSDQRRSGRSAVLLLGVVAARAGDPELVEGEPVRQPVEQRRALRGNRAGDLGTDRGPGHCTWSSASAPAAPSAVSDDT